MRDGWIDCKKALPEIGKHVEIEHRINLLPCPLWESTGRVTPDFTWCVKKAKGMTLRNSKPTHWRYIKQQ